MDESEKKLTCTMSDANCDSLPDAPSFGDILCLRKVTVEKAERQLVVVKVSSISTTWLLFRKEENFKPSCFANVTPGLNERIRINELKAWASRQGIA